MDPIPLESNTIVKQFNGKFKLTLSTDSFWQLDGQFENNENGQWTPLYRFTETKYDLEDFGQSCMAYQKGQVQMLKFLSQEPMVNRKVRLVCD